MLLEIARICVEHNGFQAGGYRHAASFVYILSKLHFSNSVSLLYFFLLIHTIHINDFYVYFSLKGFLATTHIDIINV